MADKLNVPAGFGGLVRYNEEYDSKLRFKPEYIVIFIILVIAFVLILKVFWPLA